MYGRLKTVTQIPVFTFKICFESPFVLTMSILVFRSESNVQINYPHFTVEGREAQRVRAGLMVTQHKDSAAEVQMQQA